MQVDVADARDDLVEQVGVLQPVDVAVELELVDDLTSER